MRQSGRCSATLRSVATRSPSVSPRRSEARGNGSAHAAHSEIYRGADVLNRTESAGQTDLMRAVRSSSFPGVTGEISFGADTNDLGSTKYSVRNWVVNDAGR